MWVKILMAVNVFIYKLTGGALGGKMAGQNVLLLHTMGRKSGKAYITPTNYYQENGNYVIVASNWGKPSHPDWYYNLMAQGSASVQIKDRILRVHARQVGAEDYDRLWRFVTSQNPFYGRYQELAGRQIPLIILTPDS
jgi:deazaflavin-dependent oxidoreductase (nitroreductase family)